ncbi:MAG: hypothetical protein OXM55_03815 [Bdellovibrionales bacterium]|nr:hypothetical protein [Bdellovibrionales bacterium]
MPLSGQPLSFLGRKPMALDPLPANCFPKGMKLYKKAIRYLSFLHKREATLVASRPAKLVPAKAGNGNLTTLRSRAELTFAHCIFLYVSTSI